MSSQQAFLNSLLDFSNLQPKIANNNNVKVFPSSKLQKQQNETQRMQKVDKNREFSTKNSQNEIFDSNQKLLKAFNSLREKLTQVNRQNIGLKENLLIVENQLQDYKNNYSNYTTQINALTKKLTQSEQQCAQYKLRLNSTKQLIMQNEKRNEQLEKSKSISQRLIEQNKRLKQELKISMQLSVHQKFELQQEIQTLKLKNNDLISSSQQTQNQLNNKKTDLIRLQNQYRKLKLLYEQQLFMKTVDSETVFLRQENQELKLLNDDLSTKLKKQKNKKYQLETQLLNLEQKVRLFGTKTDIYEGQLDSALKKIKKVQKLNYQNKKCANQALDQKLSWEEKFLHSTVILEELISRVKRQLKGDAVQLAKTCQFRLNKLKNDQKIDIKEKPFLKRSKSSSAKKIRSQSKKIIKPIEDIQQQQRLFVQQKILEPQTNTQTKYIINKSANKQDFSKTVLKQRPYHNVQTHNTNFEDVKMKLFSDMTENPKNKFNNLNLKTNENQIFSIYQQSMYSNKNNQISLQAKIRKERELMEKKLRQKILYHKIQDETSQTMKKKLRQDYLNMNCY